MIKSSMIISAPGDESVGIFGATWEINDIVIDDDNHREEVRKAFSEAFTVLTGEKVSVMFNDNFQPEKVEA